MVSFFRVSLLAAIILLWYSSATGQGKIFNKEDADELFGPVLHSIEVSVNALHNFTNQTTNQLMFRIRDNQLIILDNKRKILYPAGVQIASQEVFTVYSITMINELLSNVSTTPVRIEQRRDVLSISYGQMTMEVGSLCPPICN
jgi:hypothetical protein